MNITLPEDFAKLVNERVSSGMYPNADEYFKDSIRQAEIAFIRREVQKGLDEADRGEFVEYGYEELMKEIDEELQSD